MSNPGFFTTALVAFLAVLTSATALRHQMREFQRLGHASDETLSRRGVTRSGEIARILDLPKQA